MNGIGYGSVLMDNSALNIVGSGITGKDVSDGFEVSLYDLVESLILHDNIFVEKAAFDKDEMAQLVSEKTGGLVRSLDVSDKDLEVIYQEIFRAVPTSGGCYFDDDLTRTLALSKYIFEKDTLYPLPGSNKNDSLSRIESLGPYKGKLDREEIVKIRTLIYYFLSHYHGIPYVPSSFRIPILLDLLRTTKKNRSFADQAIRMTEEAAKSKVDSDSLKVDRNVFQVQFPILTTLIDFNPEKPGDTIARALEAREKREAKKFREWCSRLDRISAEEESPEIDKAWQELEELQREVLGAQPRQLLAKIKVKVNLLIFAIECEFDVPTKRRRNKHLVFLRNLLERASGIHVPDYIKWYRAIFRR